MPFLKSQMILLHSQVAFSDQRCWLSLVGMGGIVGSSRERLSGAAAALRPGTPARPTGGNFSITNRSSFTSSVERPPPGARCGFLSRLTLMKSDAVNVCGLNEFIEIPVPCERFVGIMGLIGTALRTIANRFDLTL